MDNMDYWRLCDELNIIQAALLIVGIDPTYKQTLVENKIESEQPTGYQAVKTAILTALIQKNIEGTCLQDYDVDITGDPIDVDKDSVSVHRSIIKVDSLKAWLLSRGVKNNFFFQNAYDNLEFLNPEHPRYASKLAAAVNAWLAMDDESLIDGKTPKQALDKWLRQHAVEYNLSDNDGKPNEQGIQECAKVANWKDKGGAPKTPG